MIDDLTTKILKETTKEYQNRLENNVGDNEVILHTYLQLLGVMSVYEMEIREECAFINKYMQMQSEKRK